MRAVAQRKVEADVITVRERRGDTHPVNFRVPKTLLKEMETICEKENVDRTELFLGWIRAGIADYKANGLKKI